MSFSQRKHKLTSETNITELLGVFLVGFCLLFLANIFLQWKVKHTEVDNFLQPYICLIFCSYATQKVLINFL